MEHSDGDRPAAAAPGPGQLPAAAATDAARTVPAAPQAEAVDLDPAVELGVTDSRTTVAYLVARGSDDYIAVMDVLEASVTAMTPAEVTRALAASGHPMEEKVVTARLNQLLDWAVVSARTDNTLILRFEDIVGRNWRFTATPLGRQAQRFWRNYLSGTQLVREIPLTSLERLVSALEQLAGLAERTPGPAGSTAELIALVFTSHDDLDGALVGAEDALTGLADRFDLDEDRTGQLKRLLLDYATSVAAELSLGSGRAARALEMLRPTFGALATEAVDASAARDLITRGALVASKGGRLEDWLGLAFWCDPERGRAQLFSMRLARAIPGMHANLRRLHSSSGQATSRVRALALAKACHASPALAPALFVAALGDHPWRKLHGEADDDDLPRVPSWHAGPPVAVPDLLRLTGRSGARGRPAAPRDDAAARAEVDARRRLRQEQHAKALGEVLAAAPGAALSEPAARLALSALMAAARQVASGPARTAARDGLACTVFFTPGATGALLAPTWRVWLPGRTPAFHAAGSAAAAPAAVAPDVAERALVVVDGAA